MTQKSAHDKSSFYPISSDFAAIAKERFEKLSAAQTELFEGIQDANNICLDRIRSETAAASEFVSKLTTSHSISDTADAYQEWTKRHMELFAEDGKRLMAESQKFVARAAHLLSSG